VAIDAVRRRRRRGRHETPARPDDRARDPAPPFTEEVEARDLRASLLEAIGRLPRRQATAVLLHVVEEQSYADIARAMGCSEATVRVNVMRGRARLARQMARERPDLAEGPERGGKEGRP